MRFEIRCPSESGMAEFPVPSAGRSTPTPARTDFQQTYMTVETHSQLANFIWGICNLLRGPYKRNEYRKVILPLTVLRRFDCILAPSKAAVLKEHAAIKAKPENIIRHKLSRITGH